MQVATALANEHLHGARRDQAVFHLADALSADLPAASVVWLDNQAWPPRLMTRVYAKLLAELPAEALVAHARADGSISLLLNVHSLTGAVRALLSRRSWVSLSLSSVYPLLHPSPPDLFTPHTNSAAGS